MGWFSRWTTGIDTDEEAKRAEDLAKWQANLDAAPRMQRVWSPDDWFAHEQQLASEAAAFNPATYDDQIRGAAVEGAVEGLDAMQAGVRDTLTGAVAWSARGIFGFVPWWIWLLAVGYLAWQFGFLKAAVGKLAR